MKINCTQCGSQQIVIESNFFLRCPYCNARIIVDPPENTPAMVEPSVSEEYVRRLFPSGMVSSMEMKFFPYLETGTSSDRKIQHCFSQPWQDLEEYLPPSGNMKVFDESLAEPDQLIPFDRDMAEESSGRVIFHPFFIVMLNLEGYSEGLLVDAVSGRVIGEPPVTKEQADSGKKLYRTFFLTLAAGLAFTLPIYILSKSLDEVWLSRIWKLMFIIPLALGFHHFIIKTGRK
ncbi:MAG: hypothetical protein K8S24_08860 [Candidatus Aegiribacteria sp.]|nr:hypothetical protein [Candidatus Aegiribacteria sp.]